MTVAVDFRNVDIVFGADQAGSLAMIDAGATRAEILEKTGNVLGCAGANLTVHEGEISVLMGLSGSGKSTLLRAVNRLNVVSRGQVLVKDGDRTVDELLALDTFDPSPVGWMGDFDAKTSSFVYLCGVLVAADSPVPDGFDVRAIGPTNAAVGWVQGEPDELVPVAQELTERAMSDAGVAADDAAGWALEMYTDERYTRPSAGGEVVLDFYIPCLEPSGA